MLKASTKLLSREPFKKAVMLLGAPGVGKGSYASKVSNELHIPHLTTGDMIRDEIKRETPLGVEFQTYTSAGQLVPDQLVIDLIMGQLRSVIDSGSGFLLDGFPRNIPQAEAMKAEGIDLDLVVNLTQNEEVIVDKIVNRRVCDVCGNNYNFAHIIFDDYEMLPLEPEVEGVCDQCGSKDSLIQREDDTEEVVRDRLEVYRNETFPLIEYYTKEGILKEFVVNGGTKQLLPSFIDLLYEN